MVKLMEDKILNRYLRKEKRGVIKKILKEPPPSTTVDITMNTDSNNNHSFALKPCHTL